MNSLIFSSIGPGNKVERRVGAWATTLSARPNARFASPSAERAVAAQLPGALEIDLQQIVPVLARVVAALFLFILVVVGGRPVARLVGLARPVARPVRFAKVVWPPPPSTLLLDGFYA